MINILTILGCAAIGGAIGLAARMHDKRVKKEYVRGHNDGYNLGYALGKSVYSHDDKNIFTIDIRKDYNFKFGNHLWDAQQLQSAAMHCSIDVFFKRDEFLKLVIRSGEFNEKCSAFSLKRSNSEELNETLFKKFMDTYIEVENGNQTTTKED